MANYCSKKIVNYFVLRNILLQNELLTYLWYMNLGCTLRGLGAIKKFNNNDNDDKDWW